MSGSADLRDLYQDAILLHGRRPRNRRATADFSHRGHAENPLCGDEVVVGLDIDDHGVIRDVAFEGQSCAIATASASLMTEVLAGRTPAQARRLFDRVRAAASGGAEAPPDGSAVDARLAVLSCVRAYPERVECATLAWRGMLEALDNPKDPR